MSIAATLGLLESSVRKGGGYLWIVEYDVAKIPELPHATLDTAAIATATTLSCYHAVASGELNVPIQFGSSGDLDIDIFAKDAAAEQKAYSALATSDFTIAALTTGRSAGAVVKKKSTDDYTLTAWKNFGHLGGSTPQDKCPSTSDYNEIGNKVASFDGDRDVKFLTVNKQTSKDVIDFLTKESPGKFYALKYVVEIAGLGHQIWVFRCAKIVRDFEGKFENAPRSIPVTFEIITVGTNQPYVVYEG